MGEVSSLITKKVETVAEAEDYLTLRFKHETITTLLPYAVWQERYGKPEMLSMILHAARASGMLWFMWYRVNEFFSTLLSVVR